jgi:hypothetical protein
MPAKYSWWSREATDKLPLKIGAYNRITGHKDSTGKLAGECRWVPDRDGDGMVDGYIHLYYTLKAGFDHGVVRRQLVREKFAGKPDDATWIDDVEVSGLVTDWAWWLAPWTGAIEKGRAYRLEVKPRAGIATMSVGARYMKAYYLNGLG